MSAVHTRPGGSYRSPRLEHATVRDAMHPGVMACDPQATLAEVARMMATHHVHAIAVIGITADDAGESLAWGIISDVDVVRAAIGGGDGPAVTLARRPGASVEPTMPLRDAAELLVHSGASHVLVVDSDTQHPVGVLSTFDIAGVLAWGEA